MRNTLKLFFPFLFLLVFAASCSSHSDTKEDNKEQVELTVSAATSLQNVLTELQNIFEKDHSNVITI